MDRSGSLEFAVILSVNVMFWHTPATRATTLRASTHRLNAPPNCRSGPLI